MKPRTRITPPRLRPERVNVERESAAAEKALERLAVAAVVGGNVDASRALVRLAALVVGETTALCSAQHEHACEIARGRVNWPLLIDVRPKQRERTLRWIQILPLGVASGWRIPEPGKKSADFLSGMNGIVYFTLLSLQAAGRAFDFRTREDREEAFRAIWQRILEENDGAPEKNDRFESICKRFNALSSAEQPRQEIRKELKKAFNRLIAPPAV